MEEHIKIIKKKKWVKLSSIQSLTIYVLYNSIGLFVHRLFATIFDGIIAHVIVVFYTSALIWYFTNTNLRMFIHNIAQAAATAIYNALLLHAIQYTDTRFQKCVTVDDRTRTAFTLPKFPHDNINYRFILSIKKTKMSRTFSVTM